MTRPELTFEEFCQLPFSYRLGFSGDWGAQWAYRNDECGVQIEVRTKRKRHGDIYGGWKPEERFYFLDWDERQFNTLDQVYVAYMEKVCGVEA